MEEGKRKGTNKSYSLTYRGSRKDSEKFGPMYEETPNLYQLPPIGTNVIVRQKEVFVRSLGDGDKKGEEHLAWRIPSRFYDAFHKPAVFTIKGYTRGIENPLDDSNDVILVRNTPGGYILTERIRTIYVASGSMQLLEV